MIKWRDSVSSIDLITSRLKFWKFVFKRIESYMYELVSKLIQLVKQRSEATNIERNPITIRLTGFASNFWVLIDKQWWRVMPLKPIVGAHHVNSEQTSDVKYPIFNKIYNDQGNKYLSLNYHKILVQWYRRYTQDVQENRADA